MEVRVRLSGKNRGCIVMRCREAAQLSIQQGHSVMPYCFEDFAERAERYRDRGSIISYSDGARDLVTARRGELIA